MAIDIKFDLAGNPEPPTIILANRNGNKLGQLYIDEKSIGLKDPLNDASEITFTLNKYIDGRITNLWDEVTNFKLIWCKEWDMWFEATVELDEETETVKTVFCKQLGQAELSQIKLYNIEINTEKDIERDDYKITILYDPYDRNASLLDRILEKAPHYSIAHVDFTIANIQRSFSFDDKSIYDAFQEIAEEIGCLFVFNSNSDDNGNIQRTISVYDLQQNCLDIDCGYRGEFTDVCPKCGSINIKYGYGEDTAIFVTADELASSGIQFTTDTDSVKNCFKLEAGDDLMTATVRNCNPNGSDYIWYFSEDTKKDMPVELVNKIESYDEVYKDYYYDYESSLDTSLVNSYNNLVNKYSVYNNDLQKITTPIKGYPALMNAYYNVVDLSLYLKSGLMPSIEMSETNAKTQAGLLTAYNLSPVAVSNISSGTSLETLNSAVLSMAKIIVKPTYKVKVNTSSMSGSGSTRNWTGNFVVTSYSDEEDTAISNTITVRINSDFETFVKQKIEKVLNKENTDDLSITGLFSKSYDGFCADLKRYALNPLTSFHDACQACIDILIEQGIGDDTTNNLYKNLYTPYYNKLMAIESEMKIREDEINLILGVYDSNDVLITEGLITNIERAKVRIQEALDFENYLGTELWLDFCAYRREDKYSNDNYISDGLNNAELFEKALEFIEVAENEIFKSSELQHSISTTLNNLLAIPKFKPLVESFKVGNWIRVQINDEIYKLRLLEYEIDYSDFDRISVEFSDVSKIKSGISDIESILSQASSMASSYDSVQRQAKQGDNARNTIERWLETGLNSALVKIQNNENEEIIITKNGLLGRSYNEITDTYSPEQFKLTHNIMAYTDDNWQTIKQAIGKHNYNTYDTAADKWITSEGYGMSSRFVTAGQVMGSRIVGGEIYSNNYHRGTVGSTTDTPKGTYINLETGDFELGGKKIVYDGNDVVLNGVTIKWDSITEKPAIENIDGLSDYIQQIKDIDTQLDKRAETWYQDSDPSTAWTTDELKKVHVGDLWHYTGETGKVNGEDRIKNSEWVWQQVDGIYQWVSIEVSDKVFDTIDGVASIYVTVPANPVVGDLLIPTTDIADTNYKAGKVYRYNGSSWNEVAYTDDSALTTFISGEYADDLATVNTQLDKRAQTWYQKDDPATTEKWFINNEEDKRSLHVGDLWYDTDNNGKTYVYNSSYKWEEMNGVPSAVFDMADGSCSLFVIKPSNYRKNDIWILEVENADGKKTDYPKYEKGTLLIASADNIGYSVSDWSEQVKYSAKLNAYIENISKQIDGKADTYYQANAPHPTYTSVANNETYNLWVGDLWYDTDNGKTYIYQKTDLGDNKYSYEWKYMDVTKDVFDTIDGIATIYVTEPNSQNEGDLLIPSEDIPKSYEIIEKKFYKCTKDSSTFNFDDWVEITSENSRVLYIVFDYLYTTVPYDKSYDILGAINKQNDKKAVIWYQTNDPSESWTTAELKSEHAGDMWCNPDIVNSNTNFKGRMAVYDDNGAICSEYWAIPNGLYDASINASPSIYVSQPSSQKANDFLILYSMDKFEKNKVYRCTATSDTFNPNDWVEVDYTDDTKANEAYDKANSALSLADEVKKQGDVLRDALGFTATEIAENYILTPSLGTGHLLVGNVNGNTYAKIDGNGKLTCTGASISGNVNISQGSLFIGDNSKDEDGNYTGIYAEITNDGKLTCTDASISGHINATSGTIGRVEIVDGTLQVVSRQVLQNFANGYYDEEDTDCIDGSFISGTSIMSPSIYAGKFYATGKGRNSETAYYIYDSYKKSTGKLGNLVGYLSYDDDGEDEIDSASKRVLLASENDAVLKLYSDDNMSLDANGTIYIGSSTSSIQFGGNIVLQQYDNSRYENVLHYGTQDDMDNIEDAVEGQLFFLIEE